MREGSGEAASSIGVLLSKDSTECGNEIVNGREHIVGEKACQSNVLWGQREQKIGRYIPIEMSADE
jgi:hypothetical protein